VRLSVNNAERGGAIGGEGFGFWHEVGKKKNQEGVGDCGGEENSSRCRGGRGRRRRNGRKWDRLVGKEGKEDTLLDDRKIKNVNGKNLGEVVGRGK